jgi:hypothetical protein
VHFKDMEVCRSLGEKIWSWKLLNLYQLFALALCALYILKINSDLIPSALICDFFVKRHIKALNFLVPVVDILN